MLPLRRHQLIGTCLHSQRVLAIPAKRYERGPVEFITQEDTAVIGLAAEMLCRDPQSQKTPVALTDSERPLQILSARNWK